MEEEILQMYWEQNEQAVFETEKKYGPALFRLFRNIVGNREDASVFFVLEVGKEIFDRIYATGESYEMAVFCRMMQIRNSFWSNLKMWDIKK